MFYIIPTEWYANLGAGAALMIVELIIVYFIIGFVVSRYQKHQDKRRWSAARRDFVARKLFALANASHTSSVMTTKTEGRRHLYEKFDYTADLFDSHSEDIEWLSLKYNPAIPPEWLYTVATISGRVKTANHWAQVAKEELIEYYNLVGDSISKFERSTLPKELIKRTNNGIQFITDGANEEEKLKAQISECLYAIADEMTQACRATLRFVEENFSDSELDETSFYTDVRGRDEEMDCCAIKKYLKDHSDALDTMRTDIANGEFHFTDIGSATPSV